MNNTNRILNRVFLAAIGTLLLVLGLIAVLVVVVPGVRTRWQETVGAAQESLTGLLTATPLFGTGHSWIGIAAVAVLLVMVLWLGRFIIRQGRGRTTRLLRDDATAHGVTIVDSAVAEDFLAEALANRPELVSAAVTTFEVRGTPTLRVSVTARRGVSPRDIARTVEQATHMLDAVLGRQVPTIVHIRGGLRARTAGSTRLQ